MTKRFHILCAAILLASSAWQTALAKDKPKTKEKEKGRQVLFDGKHTNGWEMVGPGELKLENGELVTYGGMGMLWYSKEKLGDCKIRVLFKLSAADDNSGVFVRIADRPKTPMEAVNNGYEIQIDNTGNEWHRTGCLYSLTKAKAVVSPKPGEWAKMVITLKGKRTKVAINGITVTDYTEGEAVPPKVKDYEPDRHERPVTGYIGLQNHGGDAHVHFKEVSVKKLKADKEKKKKK